MVMYIFTFIRIFLSELYFVIYLSAIYNSFRVGSIFIFVYLYLANFSFRM